MRSSFGIENEGSKRELALSVLTAHGNCRLKLFGTSMLPTIWPEETVLVEVRPPSEFRVGDIVFFERAGRFFLHRVRNIRIGVYATMLTTRGDAMPQDDIQVAASSVLGVLVGVRRGDAWVALSKTLSWTSRVLAALAARSTLLARLVLAFRNRSSVVRVEVSPEAPAA